MAGSARTLHVLRVAGGMRCGCAERLGEAGGATLRRRAGAPGGWNEAGVDGAIRAQVPFHFTLSMRLERTGRGRDDARFGSLGA
jgi:hypothetical protein